jgi:hypothetical protein
MLIAKKHLSTGPSKSQGSWSFPTILPILQRGLARFTGRAPRSAMRSRIAYRIERKKRFALPLNIPNLCLPVASPNPQQRVRFRDARPVGRGEKLHRFFRGLVVRALLADQSAGGDVPAVVAFEKLSILLTFLVPKQPAPIDEDLSNLEHLQSRHPSDESWSRPRRNRYSNGFHQTQSGI